MKENVKSDVLPDGRDSEWKKLLEALDPTDRQEAEAIRADLVGTRTSIRGRHRLGQFVARTEKHGMRLVLGLAMEFGFRTTGPLLEAARIVSKIPRQILPEIDRIVGEKRDAIDWTHVVLLAAAPGLPEDEDARVAFLVPRLEMIVREGMGVDELREMLAIERRRTDPGPSPGPQDKADPDTTEPALATFNALLEPVMALIDAENLEVLPWGMRLLRTASDIPPRDIRKLLAHLRHIARTYKDAIKLRGEAMNNAIKILKDRCPRR